MSTSVLLVEDTEGIRDTLSEILRNEGYDVVTARNGADALRILVDGAPVSVILFDRRMPEMDGAAFAAELKQNPRWAKIPAVLMSADAESRRDVRADAYLDKPINLNELFSILEQYR